MRPLSVTSSLPWYISCPSSAKTILDFDGLKMLLNFGSSDLGVMVLDLSSAFIQKWKLDPQCWETPSCKFLSRRKQDLAFVEEEVGRSDLGGSDPESNP